MKKLALTTGLIALAFALVWGAAPSDLSAQELDGFWMKTVVKAKGFAWEPGGKIKPKKVKAKAFSKFTWNAAESTYDAEVYMLSSPGTWTSLATLSGLELYGPNENFLVDQEMVFIKPNSFALDTYGTLKIKKVRNRAGAVKKVFAHSLGCEAVLSTTNGTNTFVGGCNIVAETIPEKKLPFTP